jgi:hypothetical protein
LCKKHIGDYLDSRRVDRSKYNKDYSLALRQFEDKNLEAGIDILWSRLKEMSWEKDVSRPEDMSKPKDMEGEFVTFKELHWQIKYLGESLREVVEGQKNLKRVVHSLHIRATLFLCIPVAVIYGTFLSLSDPPP